MKPSTSQSEAIRYFATGEQSRVRVNEATYRVCRERGWLEPVEAFPFHRATDSGRAAIGLPMQEERDEARDTAEPDRADTDTDTDTDTDEIAVGDRVRGRETSGQHQTEGVVTAIHYPAGLGYYRDEPNDRPAYLRIYTIDTGKTYTSGGPMLAIVECAEKTACEPHGVNACEWCTPTGIISIPTEPMPSTGAIIAAGAIKDASPLSGLVTTWIDHGLLTKLCGLHLVREDVEGDVFVDQEGYNWLSGGADMQALDAMLA